MGLLWLACILKHFKCPWMSLNKVIKERGYHYIFSVDLLWMRLLSISKSGIGSIWVSACCVRDSEREEGVTAWVTQSPSKLSPPAEPPAASAVQGLGTYTYQSLLIHFRSPIKVISIQWGVYNKYRFHNLALISSFMLSVSFQADSFSFIEAIFFTAVLFYIFTNL